MQIFLFQFDFSKIDLVQEYFQNDAQIASVIKSGQLVGYSKCQLEVPVSEYERCAEFPPVNFI
jgi:hypothetical protein